VILHQPGDLPRFHERYFWVSLDQVVSASVIPSMMTTSTELKHYDPQDRKCYFNHERRLRFFKIYTQRNCLFECLTNFTYQKCGCVGFYMLHDNTTRICGPAKRSCVKEANVEFLIREAKFRHKKRSSKQKKKVRCNCLPSCTFLTYEIETSQLNWNWKQDHLNNDIENQT
ncbi:hypothetical protein ILUMI_19121, partial [Ignelater luminosus]